MAKAIPLFSGSKGNSYYIGSSAEGVLIDAGRSCKQLEIALDYNKVNIKSIGGIFVTHEHIDHCIGLKVFAKKYGLKVYGSFGTLMAMEEKKLIDENVITEIISDKVAIGNMEIRRFDTPHDARESCSYQITTADGRKSVVATDIGAMNNTIREIIKESDLAIIESNYDEQMLRNGEYPYNLKQRILSDRGHLSNNDCAKELVGFVKSNTVRLLLGHISENNNTHNLALNTALNELSKHKMRNNIDFTLDTAPVETQGKSIIF